MNLIYRAQICDRPARLGLPYRRPAAVNWRFQTSEEMYDYAPIPLAESRHPMAMNWRFRGVIQP